MTSVSECQIEVKKTLDKNEISETKYFYIKLINTIYTPMNIEKLKNQISVNLNLEERQKTCFPKIKKVDNKLA